MNRNGELLLCRTVRSDGGLIGRLIRVVKLPLCLFVAASAVFGQLVAHRRLELSAVAVGAALLLISCGAAALNNYQDRRLDRLLRRTRQRPVASGTLTAQGVLLLSSALLVGGLVLLWLGAASTGALAAAGMALLLYNGVYTPLKYRTLWALLPGALCGALPPYIGWLAGGGPFLGADIIVIGALFALWQIPHFWLVTLEYRDDYRTVAVPSLIAVLPEKRLRHLSIIWVAAFISVLHTALLILDGSRWTVLLLSAAGLVLLAVYTAEMVFHPEPRYRLLFLLLNGFMLVVMVLLGAGRLY